MLERIVCEAKVFKGRNHDLQHVLGTDVHLGK